MDHSESMTNVHLSGCPFNKKQLDKVTSDLNQIQNAEFTLRRVHTEDKVEGRVVPVNQLVVRATNEAVIKKFKCELSYDLIMCVITEQQK